MDILKSKNIGKKGYIKLISVYGNDEKVVRTAKASFGNYEQDIKDLGLIRYLMRNGHWQPFEFCRMDFQVKIPIYLARQWLRHRTGSFSELSGRYKELTNEFEYNNELQKKSCEYSFDIYNENLAINMPKEKARINLPLSTYTTFVFTMDLRNLLHFLKLRLDNHAQKEIRDYADVIYEWVKEYYPVIAKAFQDYELNAIKLSALDLEVLSELVSYDFMIKNITENEQYLIDKKGFGKSEVKNLLAKVEKFKKNNLEKS